MEYITHLRTRRKNEVSEHKCAPDTCVYMGVYIVRVATETEGIAIRTEKQQIYLVYKYIYIFTAHESQFTRGANRQHYYTGTYVQKKASRTETREIVLSIPGVKKNFERPPRASACTDRVETQTDVCGRVSRVRVRTVLPKSARTKRKVGKSMKN